MSCHSRWRLHHPGPYLGIFQCLGHISHTVFLYIARMMHEIFCFYSGPQVITIFEPPECKTPTSPPRSPDGCCYPHEDATAGGGVVTAQLPSLATAYKHARKWRTHLQCHAWVLWPLTAEAGIPWDDHGSIFALFITGVPVNICVRFGHDSSKHKKKTQGTQHARWTSLWHVNQL